MTVGKAYIFGPNLHLMWFSSQKYKSSDIHVWFRLYLSVALMSKSTFYMIGFLQFSKRMTHKWYEMVLQYKVMYVNDISG